MNFLKLFRKKGGIVFDDFYMAFPRTTDEPCDILKDGRFVVCKECGHLVLKEKMIEVDKIIIEKIWIDNDNSLERTTTTKKQIHTDYYCKLCKPKEVKNGKINPK